jgi:hypothetical protein
MTEEMDLLSRSVALPNAFLRVALGLNICMHGIVRWATGLRSFAESLLPIFQKTLCPDGPATASATCCQSSKQQSVLAYSLVSRLGAP